jgi:hypothetical protein
MSAVGVAILQPLHGSAVVGESAVPLVGQVTNLPPELAVTPLFFRWFSSLFPAQAAPPRYSINDAALTTPAPAPTFAPTLAVGSHVISLAASDQAGEDEAAQNATAHGGVAGGGKEGPEPCVVHVFHAHIVMATVGAAGLVLEAKAPLKWGTRASGAGPFTPDPGYHAENRLSYRWEFVPAGAPPGRATIQIVPTLAQLTFDPEHASGLPVLRYTAPLPAGMTGGYTLRLHVEDTDPVAAIGAHMATRSVTAP